MSQGYSIILFDGVCNLCNRSVQFIIKRDKLKKFRFASLQGKTGQAILEQFNLSKDAYNSFILVDKEKVYTRSAAALEVFKRLGGAWKLLYALVIVPKFIRDGLYNWIARNRYKWYGKKEECMVPTPELKNRFMEDD